MNIGISLSPKCLEEGGCRVVIWMKGNVKLLPNQAPAAAAEDLAFLVFAHAPLIR